MMVNVGTTRIYKNNQTTIPSKIRKLFDVSEDTVMDWDLNSDNVITITFKSKKGYPMPVPVGRLSIPT